MIRNKLILGLGGLLIIVFGLFLGAVKFYFAERDSRVLAEQTAVENEKVLNNFSQAVDEQIEYYTAEMNHLEIKFDAARNESDRYQKQLAKLDLDKEARESPEALEQRVNEASAMLFLQIERASGRE